jgi:hypothetical protein
MSKSALPISPFDGQVYIDIFKIKWVYNAEDDTWNKVGVATDIPIARGEDNVLGPTNGLMSARDKAMLDGLSSKAGGFGLLLKPGHYLTSDGGPDSILSGDVQFVSETLDFECMLTGVGDCSNPNTSVPTVKVGLSKNFLESYRLEISGPQGPKGDTGDKGIAGRPGTGDGPQGDPGEDGADATTGYAFTGVIYEELDDVYDTAVVDLRLDQGAGQLEVTKARLDTPGDKPAKNVIAQPIMRDVEFTSTTLDKWELSAPLDDRASTVDLNIIRLPKGWSGETGAAVPVTPIKLSNMVDSVIGYYKDAAATIISQWDTELKTWVRERDKEAREVLNNLATQLAECEFELPLEFCLGITPGDCNTSNKLGGTIILMFHDKAGSYYPSDSNNNINELGQYTADLQNLQTTIAQFHESLFTELSIRVLNPQGDQLIPDGVTPQSYTIGDIGRPPSLDELIQEYNAAASTLQFPPNTIYLLVNNSGSMLTSTIEPGYGQFVEWLGDNTNANIFEQIYTNPGLASRWIMIIVNYLKTLANNLLPAE